jgi:uncharacterized protein
MPASPRPSSWTPASASPLSQPGRGRVLALLCALLLSGQAAARTGPDRLAAAGAEPRSIAEIQGNGLASPFEDRCVVTSGVVTALKSSGFFLQMPDPGDEDDSTSDGLFVFTSGAPPLLPGDEARVTGFVVEFPPGVSASRQGTLTQLADQAPGCPLLLELLSSGNPLPEPVSLADTFPAPGGGLGQLELVEGMLVSVPGGRVTAPTNSFGELALVLPPHGRNLREPGLEPLLGSHRAPSPTPVPGVPTWDGNPEAVVVDTDGLAGSTRVQASAGMTVEPFTGVMDFNFGRYKVNASVVLSGEAAARPVRPRGADEISIASYNALRFMSGASSPGYSTRRAKHVLSIVELLGAPDIIGFQEVGTLQDLQNLAHTLLQQHSLSYQPYLLDGNDIGGINVGYLLAERIQPVNPLLPVVQHGKDETYLNPTNGENEILHDRPPLILEAVVNLEQHPAFALTLVLSHMRSRSGIDGFDSARIIAKRRAQAESLARLVDELQQTHDRALVVFGDMNAFEHTDGLADVVGIVRGSPGPSIEPAPDLVKLDLVNLVETDLVQPEERYTYVFDFNAQVLDHILVSQNLFQPEGRIVSGFEHSRGNSDLDATTHAANPARPERASDHDHPVVYLRLPGGPAQDTPTPTPPAETPTPTASPSPTPSAGTQTPTSTPQAPPATAGRSPAGTAALVLLAAALLSRAVARRPGARHA